MAPRPAMATRVMKELPLKLCLYAAVRTATRASRAARSGRLDRQFNTGLAQIRGVTTDATGFWRQASWRCMTHACHIAAFDHSTARPNSNDKANSDACREPPPATNSLASPLRSTWLRSPRIYEGHPSFDADPEDAPAVVDRCLDRGRSSQFLTSGE